MRKTSLILSAVMLVVVAACSDASSNPDESTTLPANQPEPVLLSYALTPGSEYVYDVEMTQKMVMTAEGSGSSVGEGDFPGAADVELTAKGVITYSIAEGPKPDTYEVTITGDFDDVTATGTVDGEEIDSGDVPDFAEIQPVDATVVVDEQGNIIPDEVSLDPTAGFLGGMENLTDIPGANVAQFFGPPLGDDPVTVGQSWTSTYSTPGLGDDPTETTTTGRVSGTDIVDGVEVFVIESTTETSPVEFDLAEFFVGLFSGFMPAAPSAEEQAELQALIDGLRFAVSVDAARSEATTLFDPLAGITHRFNSINTSNVAMDINFPDEATGELVGFVMDMQVEQSFEQTLVSGPNV